MTQNPIADTFGFDPKTTRWLGVRRAGRLIAVVLYTPSRESYCETCYADLRLGFTPSNPIFSLRGFGKSAEDIRRAFGRRFAMRANSKGLPEPFTVDALPQDAERIDKVDQSAFHAEYRARVTP